MSVERSSFGKLADEREALLFALRSDTAEVRITNYGGIITSIKVPDANGDLGEVVAGYDSLEGYMNPRAQYFGALIGRVANRIAGSKFTLNGEEYTTTAYLHGGKDAWNSKLWDVVDEKSLDAKGNPTVSFWFVSPHMDEGFPGMVTTQVRYTLDGSDLRIDYTADTDRDTIINLTNHSYFNLSAPSSKDDAAALAVAHRVQVNSSKITPMSPAENCPNGEYMDVEGTPFDLREPQVFGDKIDLDHEQLKVGSGFDHNYVIDRPPSSSSSDLVWAARAECPKTGRTLEVLTTEPGVQFYAGNFLDSDALSKRNEGGPAYSRRSFFCFETQHFPDAVHHDHFPSIVLKKDAKFESSTVFRFGVKK